ncbi:MAG: anti-sigma factor domain-containing protein [Solirubrobacterales bacterium]
MSQMHDDPADHERYRDDLAAYSLGALSDAEAAELLRHLEGCEDCRRQLRWLRPAVDLLLGAVAQVEPPPTLRANLIETVRAEARPDPAAAPAPRRRRDWGAPLFRPATAVAAGVLLVVGALGGYLAHQSSTHVSEVAVQAEKGAGPITGTLARTDDSAILRLQGMPTLARGQVYEAWVQRGAAMVPSSLFTSRRDRTASAAIPGGLDGAQAVLVTPEPRGGSPQPTSPPVLEAPLE